MNFMVDWMNANEGFVLGLLTAAYVVATIILVSTSISASKKARVAANRTLEHLERVEIEKHRPVVILSTYFEQLGTQPPQPKWALTNVGSGPAFSVKISLEESFDSRLTQIGYENPNDYIESGGFILGVNVHLRLFPHSGTRNEITDITKTSLNCIIDYADLFGNKFATRYERGNPRYLRFDLAGPVMTADPYVLLSQKLKK